MSQTRKFLGNVIRAGAVGSGTGDHMDPSALSAGYWGTSERFNRSAWGEDERERMDSEEGSWVIGLGGSHPDGDMQGGDWRCLGLRVLLPASRMVQPLGGGAYTTTDAIPPTEVPPRADTACCCRGNMP
ncbi:hypothetical protein P7K49_030017 [Saguinus oedipus]|uniref:Uncharacterized protein n=1 Tax=Saguinus oedipus TaxID=9490 RepID=A0ABQ9U0Y5_SAGOE|nr:hypothetical protein P7K49_030017 [Saguinus oedipus]